MKQDILVTGGAGYIGSHVVRALQENNYNPIILDNFVYGHEDIVRDVLKVPYYKADIQDEKILDQIFTQYKIKAVMHFSAYCYVGESVENPLKYYQNNVSSTLKLLGKMVENRILNFIFSSTCATYGNPLSVPITEDHPQNPINPYGQSKYMIEKILQDFDLAYQLKSVVFRYFNASGAHPESLIGEDHEPETHLIPLAIQSALGLCDGLTIHGTDYSTADGTCIRDYIHVVDLANAHLEGLHFLEKTSKSEVFNLGNGHGYSVKEIIENTKKITGRDFIVKYGPRRIGDPPVLIASAEKARRILGWEPKYSDINKIIDHAVCWHKKRHGEKII